MSALEMMYPIWGRSGFDGDRLSLDGKSSIRTRK